MTLDVYAGLFTEDLDDVAVRLNALVPRMCPDGQDASRTTKSQVADRARDLGLRGGAACRNRTDDLRITSASL